MDYLLTNEIVYTMQKLSWGDIETSVTALIIGYLDKADINCAQSIWHLLEEQNLTAYEDEIGKTHALMLSLGLVEFVNDCTALIRDDQFELDVVSWAYEVEIKSFRVAQIVGADFEIEDDYDEEEFTELALLELLSNTRTTIVTCINKKYSGTSQIMKYIGEFYDPPLGENGVSDEYLEINWDKVIIPGNVERFFEWIDNNMYSRN